MKFKDKKRNGYQARTVWGCNMLLLFFLSSAFPLKADELIDFGSSFEELKIYGRGCEKIIELPDGGKVREISLGKDESGDRVVVNPEGKIWLPQFEQLTLNLMVYVPADSTARSISLKMVDFLAESTTLSANVPKSGNNSWHNLKFTLKADSFGDPNKRKVAITTHSFSTKKTEYETNNKADFPVFLENIIVSFDRKQKGTNSLGLGKVNVEKYGVTAMIDTGREINVWDLSRDRAAGIRVCNDTDESKKLTLAYTIIDQDGKKVETASRPLTLKAWEKRLSQFKKIDRQGVYEIEYSVIENNEQAKKRCFKGNFVAMIPSGPTSFPSENDNRFIFANCVPNPIHVRLPELKKEIEALALCGTKLVRTGDSWGMIQRQKDMWDTAWDDKRVDLYAQQGMELQLCFMWTPKWAIAKDWKPIRKRGLPRPDYNAYGNYAYRLVKHFRGRVRFFEVWNEPDQHWFANFSTEEYTQMQRIAYREMKRANPKALLIAGAFGNSQSFPMQRYVFKNAPNTCDIHGYHGHGTFSSYQGQIGELLKIREERQIKQPWFPNETSVATLDDKLQASTMFKKVLFSWANGAIGYTWYNIRNKRPFKGTGEMYHLLNYDFSFRSGYVTFNMLAGLYRDCRYVSRLKTEGDVFCYRFEDDKSAIFGMWAEDRESENRIIAFSTNAEKAEFIDLYGNVKELPLLNNKTGKILLADVSSVQPGSWRLSPASASFDYIGPVVTPASRIYLQPSSTRKIEFKLMNPFAVEQNLALTLTCPDGISCAQKNVATTLTAAQTRTIAYTLKASERFKSTEDNVENLTLQVAIPALRFSQTLTYPLTPAIIVKDDVKYNLKNHLVLKKLKQLTSLVPDVPGHADLYWKGPRDLSAYIYFKYPKRDAMLIQVAVFDDQHHQPDDGTKLYMGDSIQLRFMFPRQGGMWDIGAAVFNSGKTKCSLWSTPMGFSAKEVAGKIRVTYSRNKKNVLFINTYIPFKALGISMKDLRKGFHFNAIVNDNDGKGRENYISLRKDPNKLPAEEYPVISFE